MTKNEYLERMRSRLSDLPAEEIETHLDFYREMIDDRAEEGMSEEEATAAMDVPEEAAEKILQELSLPRLVRQQMKKERHWGWKGILLVILLAPIWLLLFFTAVSLFLAVAGLAIGILMGAVGLVVAVGTLMLVSLYVVIWNLSSIPLIILGIGSALVFGGSLLLLLTLVGWYIGKLGLIFHQSMTWLKRFFIKRRTINE